jgi:hypothetical protein
MTTVRDQSTTRVFVSPADGPWTPARRTERRDEKDSHRCRERIYRLQNDEAVTLSETVSGILEVGVEYLDVTTDLLKRTDPAVASTASSPAPAPGRFRGRRRARACEDVPSAHARAGSTLALADAATDGRADDPASTTHGLSCYVGTAIAVGGTASGRLRAEATPGTVVAVTSTVGPALFTPAALDIVVREYAFELALCAALEADSDGVVARQLGARGRVLDVVEVRPGPAFDARVELTPDTIPPAAVESDVGVGRARDWRDALDCHPERAREVLDAAVEAGFFAVERHDGRRYVRRTARYPDWIGGLRAFENKPDLDRPGELKRQLRTDVSLALFDEVVVVTGSYVTGAHLNRLPDPVGVWRFDPDGGAVTVVREADPLPTDTPGLAIQEWDPGRVDVEPVDADAKARLRRRIAERAYGKGWRPEDLPACGAAAASGPAFRPDDALPYCGWKERLVEPSRECGPDCGGYEPGDPPAADPDAARADRTGWDPDPDGAVRRQSGLDRFLSDAEH